MLDVYQQMTPQLIYATEQFWNYCFQVGCALAGYMSADRDHINLQRREFMVRGKGQNRPVFVSNAAARAI